MDGFHLTTASLSGAENMAIDQAMLEHAAEHRVVLLRVYQWAEPTVSLGYFQKYGDFLQHFPRAGDAVDATPRVVRRATGGGAIVHHHDWTYSLAVPDNLLQGADSNRARQGVGASQPLYDFIHQAMVEWLDGMGWQAGKWDSDSSRPAPKTPAADGPKTDVSVAEVSKLEVSKPGVPGPGVSGGSAVAGDSVGWRRASASFLCFERRNHGDVVVMPGAEAPAGASFPQDPQLEHAKVMGSAQRRVRGGLLQHGSLLLARSPFAVSLPGLDDLPCAGMQVAPSSTMPADAGQNGRPAVTHPNLQLHAFEEVLLDAVQRYWGRAWQPADPHELSLSQLAQKVAKFREMGWQRRV
ncbi:lipoyl protein ligase domain-containing protein [Aureliella helgolandensis]|uniref:Octanoyltransferase LipM n=1 Tax=Aureliella helgolandensis TaxID=2527968 RepID=A0A518GEZ6_9BACT|nr:hypothetical protein [Aureliella helgolandensis]QDV27172.1 Octanoyltransferase LipM [Aureliella helgolandensis]